MSKRLGEEDKLRTLSCLLPRRVAPPAAAAAAAVEAALVLLCTVGWCGEVCGDSLLFCCGRVYVDGVALVLIVTFSFCFQRAFLAESLYGCGAFLHHLPEEGCT